MASLDRMCADTYVTGNFHSFGDQCMATVKVTDKTFQGEVLDAKVPVLVDFWAEWCGPCKMIGPALEELAEEYDGKLIVAKVNVDENPNLPAQFGVRGIPGALHVQGRRGDLEPHRRGAEGVAQGLDRGERLNASASGKGKGEASRGPRPFDSWRKVHGGPCSRCSGARAAEAARRRGRPRALLRPSRWRR